MTSELDSFIEILNSCLLGNFPNRHNEAKTNIINITTYFEDELTRVELDGAFTTLFDKKTGILQFISKSLKQEGFNEAIKESFILLKVLLDVSKDRTSHHILQIKDLCKSCVLLDRSAEEKDKAFDVIQSVLEKGPWDDNLNLDELFDRLIDPFQSNKSNKMPAKVLQKQLHIMGLIVRKYPECIREEKSRLLLRIYLSQLKTQVQLTTYVKYNVIVGCLNGLAEYLFAFPLKPLENDPNCKIIYDHIKTVAQKHKEMKVAPKAALGLIQAHGGQLAEFLFAEYKFWHEFLLTWVQSSGDDHKAGVAALDVFYKEIARILKNSTLESGSSVFLYFIEYFKGKLTSQTSLSYDLKLVIKGFGLFAGPCKKFMKPEDVVHMFTVVMQFADQIYLKEEDLNDAALLNLADYVESLSSIMMQLDNITNEQLTALQHLSVLLIRNYPNLLEAFRWFAISALIITLCNLADSGGAYLDDFLKDVVYQGVIRSCSHQIALDVELQKDQVYGTMITFRNYVPLWKALLNPHSYEKKSRSVAVTNSIVVKVYDELIDTTLVLIKKLDLSTRKKKTNVEVLNTSLPSGSTCDISTLVPQSGEDDIPILDPESGLEANRSKDFTVFINLVDLMRDVLSTTECNHFEKWIEQFSYQVISESSHKPLVSGFYKLITLSLQLCNKLDYFSGYEGVQNQSNDRKACYILLCRFLQELLIQLQQYKNDLQIACLETVMAAPLALVIPLLPHAAPAFEAVFRVGQSMLSLARLGVSALDKWNSMLPPHLMKPLLVKVLPCLDPFLRSKGIDGDLDTTIDKELVALGRKHRTGYSKSRRVIQKNIVERPESELTLLQRDIISLLGQLDSTTCLILLKDGAEEDQDAVSWAMCLQSLAFPLPYRDLKLKIKLEKLIPRVVELALTSSDRYTRFSACEFLHAIITFMLGCSRETKTPDSDDYSKLFEKLALPMLKLGCHPDEAIRSLYSVLVYQLIHWYSSKFKLKSKGTGIMIQTLLDGITHPTDTALRDFSARCLHEFVDWSIRQLSDKDLEKSPANIKALLKQMYSFCLHPCPSKRLGAALVLNSIYRVLRETESVVSQFWLELLYYMIMNLSLAEEMDSIPGSQEQVVTAITHIERVLKEKSALFNKGDKIRRKPPEFDGVLLRDAVSWLLQKCGTVQADCRHKCMNLVYTLAPLLPDCNSGAQFVSWYAKTNSWISLLKICEGSVERGGIALIPTVRHLRIEVDLDQVLRWLHLLLTSLDCYVWFFGTGIVQPSDLVTERMENISQARIFEAMTYFIQHVSHCDANTVIQSLSSDVETHADMFLITPWEAKSFDSAKCSITIRIFDMIAAILQSSEPHCLPDSLLSLQLWQLIVTCILHPASLGFDLRSTEVIDGLPKNLIELLSKLQKSLPSSKMLELNSELRKAISNTQTNVLDNLQDSLKNDKITLEQKQFLQGLEILHRSEMLTQVAKELPNCFGLDGEKIVKELFSVIVEGTKNKRAVLLEPASLAYAQALLKFAFLLGEQVETVMCCLRNETSVKNPATQSSIQHGEYFFVTFRSIILEHMLENTERSFDLILEDIREDNIQWIVRILIQLLQHFAKNKKTPKRDSIVLSLEKSIVNKWNRLSSLGEGNGEQVHQLLGLVITLAKLLPQPIGGLGKHETLQNWVLAQIATQNLALHHKSRALDLLVCLTDSQEDVNQQLRSALQTLRERHFPQLSTELHPGSVEYSSFVSAFRKVLHGLEISGSRVILHCVVAMAAGEKQHVLENEIQQSLQVFIKRLDFDQQVKALQVVYDIFKDEQYDPSVRLGCAQRFIQPLLQDSRPSAAREFYKGCIQGLQKMLNDVLDKRSGLQAEHQLVGRIGAWNLLELLFVKLETHELESKECVITAAAFPNAVSTGKELISDLTTRAYKYRSETLLDNLSGDTRLVELFRQSQCAAYKTLVAIISNTKTELKFYTGLLFNESKTKEVPLEKLVDCKKTYSLFLDWEEIPKRRKQLVSIRSEARAYRREVMGFASQSIRYLPNTSQYLFDSTLNEDVTQFDFSTSVVTKETSSPVHEERAVQELIAESTEVSLESDDLNQHECMATLCGLIKHMVDKGISPTPDAETKDAPLPSWMESLRKCLHESTRPRNVRLFILKLILNMESRFRPYAHHWLNSILKAIDDGVLGSAANYLLSDTVAMLIQWRGKLISSPDTSDHHLVTQLLYLLINNVHHERRDVFKHNLEMIRTVVELWKPNFDIPIQLLYGMIIKHDRKNPRLSEPGIQVTAIILANGLEPWSSTGKLPFLTSVLRNIDIEKREVFQPAAEVAGMALKLLDSNGSGMLEGDDATFLSMLWDKLDSLKERYKDKFIICLFAVQEHYALIVDKFMKYVLFHLPKTYGSFRIMCLKIVFSRQEILGDELYTELKSKGFFKMLSHRDPDQQNLILNMVKKMLAQLNYEQLKEVVEEVCKFETHQSVDCRSVMYHILMWVYDHFKNDENPLSEQSKSTLLKGLRDDDSSLQDTIFKYWNNDARQQNATTADRLLFVISHLYSPSTEHYFLGYSAQFLLEATTITPDYNEKIFSTPLTDCQYQDYKPNLHWRSQHVTIAPMFADTLASQLIQSQSLSMSGETFGAEPLIRATQTSLAFQPTIDPGESSSGTLSLSFRSSLFTIGSGDERKPHKMRPNSHTRKLESKSEGLDEVDNDQAFGTPNLHKRFLRNEKQLRNFFAGREIKRSARRKELEQERGRRRDANVASFRKYRIGDFPDIEIPYSAIIRPMQELSKRDAAVARQLLVLLFEGLLNELSEKGAFIQGVQEAIKKILNITKDYSAMLMGAVMEIALENGKYITLDAESIVTASQASGLLSLGCLLLEETLISVSAESEPTPSKRSPQTEESKECLLWFALADLYRNMDEWDVVRGIFHKHLNCGEEAQRALKWEASAHWYEAKKNYEAALSIVDETDILNTSYYEALYKCLANMSEWEQLNKHVKMQAENNLEKLWADDWFQEKLLPQLFMSEVHLMLDKGIDDRQKFIEDFDVWLTNKDRNNHLINHYSEELAMIFLLQNNAGRACQQVERSLTTFLDSWAELNPLSKKLRTKQLLELQKTAEIQAYLKFATVGESSKSELKARDLVKRWSNNLPCPFDSLLLWDSRTMYRKKFASHIDQRVENINAADALSKVQLAMVETALSQGNFSIAKKYLKQSQAKLAKSGTDLEFKWNLAYSRAKWLQVNIADKSEQKFKLRLLAWEALDSHMENQKLKEHPMLHVETLQHVSTMSTGILQHLEKEPDVLKKLPVETIKKLATRIEAPNCSPDVLTQHLKQHGLSSLKRAAELVSPITSSRAVVTEQAIAKAHLEIARYCRAYGSSSETENNFNGDIVTSILRAMRYGSKEARQLFPCLLEILGLDTHLSELFCQESKDVPVWMFLGWVNQLFARLDTPVGSILYDLVLHLSQTYPQAMIYAFQLSREKYNLDSNASLKALVQQLETVLFTDQMIDNFLSAFSCLGQPCKMLQYYLEKLIKLLTDENVKKDSLCSTYDTMVKELFPAAHENVQLQEKIHGNVFHYVEKFWAPIKKLESGIKRGDKKKIPDLHKIMNEVRAVNWQPPKQLDDYSPWLSKYQPGRYGSMEIEIPGQYTGESKPLVQHHVKIAGFGKHVVVLDSMRRPLILTILGSDAREHRYLVKFGEDLRQDQRLEQLFNLMNKILDQDPTCRSRNLSITTYQVVPFTSHLGIIQFVNATESLKKLIEGVLNKSETANYNKAFKSYIEWIRNKKKGSRTASEEYGDAYMAYTRDQTIAAFREKVNRVPLDLMRRVLQGLSTSQEYYFSLRQNFACSYAVLCIAHWLLGIGDRHLENTLVSVQNGHCVGIDFGMAFGTATQFLPVPELMPFRLTPHIVSLLQPLEETGLLRETMIHCMRALRNNYHTLLATMEVFVQEPSVDWLDFARKHESTNKESYEGDQEWYPKQKLDLARLKFEGANPVTVTSKELTAGFKNSKYLPKFLETVKGSPSNIRAMLSSLHLSPEDQVDCLLDHAMDYNILGKTWVGWKPWI